MCFWLIQSRCQHKVYCISRSNSISSCWKNRTIQQLGSNCNFSVQEADQLVGALSQNCQEKARLHFLLNATNACIAHVYWSVCTVAKKTPPSNDIIRTTSHVKAVCKLSFKNGFNLFSLCQEESIHVRVLPYVKAQCSYRWWWGNPWKQSFPPQTQTLLKWAASV